MDRDRDAEAGSAVGGEVGEGRSARAAATLGSSGDRLSGQLRRFVVGFLDDLTMDGREGKA